MFLKGENGHSACGSLARLFVRAFCAFWLSRPRAPLKWDGGHLSISLFVRAPIYPCLHLSVHSLLIVFWKAKVYEFLRTFMFQTRVGHFSLDIALGSLVNEKEGHSSRSWLFSSLSLHSLFVHKLADDFPIFSSNFCKQIIWACVTISFLGEFRCQPLLYFQRRISVISSNGEMLLQEPRSSTSKSPSISDPATHPAAN